MKVKVIGCGTSWTERATSSYCINDHILVDCGEGTTKLYKKCDIDFNKIDTIFITHLHSDHVMGMAEFICSHLLYIKSATKKLTVYGLVGLLETLKVLQKYFVRDPENKDLTEHINVVEINDFTQSIYVDDMCVTMHLLNHGNLDDIAYIFDDGKTKLGFSGDCTYDSSTQTFIENCDCIFLDCAGQTTTLSHIGLDDFKTLQKQYPQKRFIAVHCSDNVFDSAKQSGIEAPDTGDIYEF